MAEYTPHEAPAHNAQSLPVMLPGKLTGRDKALAQIYSSLKSGKPLLLHGAAGMGKTALAGMLASAYTELPGGVLWLAVEDSPLEELIVRVGRAYGVDEIRTSQAPIGMLGSAAATLSGHKPLVVLDGRHNVATATDFVERLANGLPVLLVSRDGFDGPWDKLDVQRLEPEAGIALFRQASGLTDPAAAADEIDELVSILDYIPFAIVVAGGTMRAARKTPADFLTEFEKIPSSAAATPQLLALTVGFRSLNNALQGIILLMGATFGEGAPSELLGLMAGAPTETIEQVMGMLAHSHLVERTERYGSPYYRLHDITAAFAATWLRSQGRLDMLQGKAKDAVLSYARKYAVNSPAAFDRLAAAMNMLLATARWSAEQGDRDFVNQLVIQLMQAGDFVNERGYVYELLKLRALASSFTTAFPAYPFAAPLTPPLAPARPEDVALGDEDELDEDDEDQGEEAPVAVADASPLVKSLFDRVDQPLPPQPAAPASLLDLDDELEEDEAAESEELKPDAEPADLAGLQTALRAARAQNDLTRQVELLRKIGELQAAEGHDNESISTYTEALGAYETLDQPDQILEVLDTLSMLLVKTENSSAAILHANRGLKLADELGDVESKMFLLVTLGDARQQLGESDEAARVYGQALEIARNAGDAQNEAQVLLKLGYAQLDGGQPEVAADNWEQALKLFRSQNRRDYEGRVLGALGTAYGELGRWEEAINFHTSALYIAREVKDRDAEGLELSNLGYAAVQANQLGQAVLRYRQALHLAYQSEDRDNIVSNIVDLVRLLAESPRHLDIAELLISDAFKLEPTDRDVLKLKERVTNARLLAAAEKINLLQVTGTARDYAANGYKLLEG